MTITEKTDKLLEKLLYCDLRNNVGIDKAKQAIRRALKEQDKDTRCACAESVNLLPMDNKTIIAAHSACINCNGGVIG